MVLDTHNYVNNTLSEKAGSPLFIAPNNIVGNDLKGTGVLIIGNAFQGGSIFKTSVPKTFSANTQLSNMTYVVSTESEKSTVISNINKFSGHYSNFSGNLMVDSVNEQKITQTSLFVLKSFSQEIGAQTFNYEGLELSPVIQSIFDPTTEANKDPAVYKQKLSNFLDAYGYYYVSAYTLYGDLSATWSITTNSIEEKSKLSIELAAKVSSGKFSFEDTNKFITESTSKYTQSSIQFASQGSGIIGNTQTIEQIDTISENFTAHITEESAAVSKVYISPWTTLPQIADYFLLITDKKLHDEIMEMFGGINLTQDIWDRSFTTLGELKSMDTLIQESVNDPYTNLFWGFLVDYDSLPIKEIQSKQLRIREFIDMFGNFKASTFVQQFQEFQDKYMNEWNSIKDQLRNLCMPPSFTGKMTSGYYNGSPSTPSVYQSIEVTVNFDPQKISINQEIVVTPTSVIYLPAVFTNVWTQGVVKFVKQDVSSKTKNPFSLLLECRTEWTLHTTTWNVQTGEAVYSPDQGTMKGNVANPAKYAGFECNTICMLSMNKI